MTKKRSVGARVVISLAKGASAVHVWLYRRTDGRRGGTIQGVPHLLITTVGRRTGLERTRPIGYCEADGLLIVCGSNGGSDPMPSWVYNLRSNPKAEVQIGPAKQAVVATEALGDEYQRRWAELTERYPVFLKYPKKTKRRIPVMLLEPIDA